MINNCLALKSKLGEFQDLVYNESANRAVEMRTDILYDRNIEKSICIYTLTPFAESLDLGKVN